MSTIYLTPGEGAIIERPVAIPYARLDWNYSTIDFEVRAHATPVGNALVYRSTKIPPGGVQLLADDRVRITLGPDDTRRLLAAAGTFDWSLELRTGAGRVHVLDSGDLRMTQ